LLGWCWWLAVWAWVLVGKGCFLAWFGYGWWVGWGLGLFICVVLGVFGGVVGVCLAVGWIVLVGLFEGRNEA